METGLSDYIAKFKDPAQRIGATYVAGKGAHVRLWAPSAKNAEIEWIGVGRSALRSEDLGYFAGHFPAAKPGDRYVFYIDGRKIADPASRFQPEDTDGPSQLYPDQFSWSDSGWSGINWKNWVIYEIHTGTFSPSHDFSGIIADLQRLKDLGITTLEIMPVSQFSGTRNWGYDGVFPHAVQHSYGGPDGLKALVDAAHRHGLAIILDVVYNHIGPEGNTLFGCGPYVQNKYKTPWGEALNYDGAGSDEVRRYFLQSAWQWLTEYHFDGLRLDAIQTILDTSPIPFMEELSRLKCEAEKIVGRPLMLIAETDMNDSRIVTPLDRGGFGLDGHWADDLHHALHATLTGEQAGYYADYGGPAQIARIYERGVAYDGNYSPFRKRRHGRPYADIDKRCLVVETQNHDQIGNRLFGERLSTLVDFEKLKLGAACVLLSPFMPFLFMGEELAVENPFLFFISHHDPKLVEAVRKGRREEWKDFNWDKEPPDPAAQDTFDRCVLTDKSPADGSKGAAMREYYRKLIQLSKKLREHKPAVSYDKDDQLVVLDYQVATVVLSFNNGETVYTPAMNGMIVINSKDIQPGNTPVEQRIDAGDVKIAPWSALVIEQVQGRE